VLKLSSHTLIKKRSRSKVVASDQRVSHAAQSKSPRAQRQPPALKGSDKLIKEKLAALKVFPLALKGSDK
jgi:hypothetical protein